VLLKRKGLCWLVALCLALSFFVPWPARAGNGDAVPFGEESGQSLDLNEAEASPVAEEAAPTGEQSAPLWDEDGAEPSSVDATDSLPFSYPANAAPLPDDIGLFEEGDASAAPLATAEDGTAPEEDEPLQSNPVILFDGCAPGDTLRADTGALQPGYALHWQSGEGGRFADIPGADGDSLLLTAQLLGQQIRLKVSYADGDLTLYSQPVGPVRQLPLPGSLSVAGKAQAGKKLSAVLSDASVSDAHVDYLWLYAEAPDATEGDYIPIDGATSSSFTPTQAQVGQYLRALAVGRERYDTTLFSEAVGPVLPAETMLPTLAIRGEALMGSPLTAVFSGPDDLAPVFVWQRALAAEGPFDDIYEGQSYTPAAADVGCYLRVTERQSGIYSPAVCLEAAQLLGTLVLTGEAVAGEALAAQLDGAPQGLSYDIVWERRPANGQSFRQIAGAGGEKYLLQSGDIGYVLRARAIGRDNCLGEVASSELGPVQKAPEPLPVVSSVDAPVSFQLDIPSRNAQETLRLLAEHYPSAAVHLAESSDVLSIPLVWRAAEGFDATPGAQSFFLWQLVDEVALDNPARIPLQGSILVTNGEPLPDLYRVYAEAGILHGALRLGPVRALPGTWIAVDVYPEAGYQTDSVYYYDPSTPDERLSPENGGFVLPAHDVAVGAVFAPLPQPPWENELPEPVFQPTAQVQPEAEVVPVSGTVVCSRLNFRCGPGTRYPALRVLKRGEVFTYLGSANGWAYIRLADGTEGYVYEKYIRVWQDADFLTVVARRLNLRRGPGTGYKRIGSLPRGTIVPVLGRKNGWVLTEAGGKSGYVSAAYLR